MTVVALSFKFYDDSGLTSATNTLFQLEHQTDLSDNPQDFHKYFGSTLSGRTLQTQTSPGVNNILLTPTRILPVWIASTAYALGRSVRPTVDNNFRYVCTTAGTTGATEPTWSTGVGSFTTSGTAVFECISIEHPVTEITLALTEADLDTNTPGAALSLGNTITSGVGNEVDVWIRVENSITTVGSNTGYPELAVYINAVQET